MPRYVEAWVRRVRLSGFSSVLMDRRRRGPGRTMTTVEVNRTREAIATALEGPTMQARYDAWQMRVRESSVKVKPYQPA